MEEKQTKKEPRISQSHPSHELPRRIAPHRSILARPATLLATASTLLLSKPVAAADYDLLKGIDYERPQLVQEDVIKILEQKKWIVVEPDSYDFELKDDYVQLSKKGDAEGFYDDGLTYVFQNNNELQEIQPRHIHFEVYTTTPDDETCDFRFYSVEKVELPLTDKDSLRAEDWPVAEKKEEEEKTEGEVVGTDESRRLQEEADAEGGEESAATETVTKAPSGPNAEFQKVEFSDVALFRLGYFNYAKLNVEQNMLLQFSENNWYAVDLIIDWSEQRVSIYINDEALKSASFFTQRKTKLESGNAVSIYGLSPGGVSRFKNIRICNDEVCEEERDKGFTDLSGALRSLQTGFSLAAGLAALFISLLA